MVLFVRLRKFVPELRIFVMQKYRIPKKWSGLQITLIFDGVISPKINEQYVFNDIFNFAYVNIIRYVNIDHFNLSCKSLNSFDSQFVKI